MTEFQRQVLLPLMCVGFALVQLVQLLMIPSNSSLEYREDLWLSPVSVVKNTNYTTAAGWRTRYYVRYESGRYFTLVKATNKGVASGTVQTGGDELYGLYVSPKKSSTYRLVESGMTLKESLKEERSPFLIWTLIYFALAVYFYWKARN